MQQVLQKTPRLPRKTPSERRVPRGPRSQSERRRALPATGFRLWPGPPCKPRGTRRSGEHNAKKRCPSRAPSSRDEFGPFAPRALGEPARFLGPAQEAAGTDVAIQLRPMDRRAADFKVGTLAGRSQLQGGIERQRHAHRAAILEFKRESFVRDLHRDDIGRRSIIRFHSTLRAEPLRGPRVSGQRPAGRPHENLCSNSIAPARSKTSPRNRPCVYAHGPVHQIRNCKTQSEIP